MENQENADILKAEIKSILAFKAQNGATFSEVKDEYAYLMGKEMNFNSSSEFIHFMSSMEDVYAVKGSDGQLQWFSNSAKSQHINVFVKEQKIQREPRTYTRSTCYYNDNYMYKSKLRKCFSNQNNYDLNKPNHGQQSSFFYYYQLVGDDFFLQLAKLDCKLPFEYITPKNSLQWSRPIKKCGHCISGLTIRGLTKLLKSGKKLSKHIILNVGSVDLLQGRDFHEMRDDFLELYSELRMGRYDTFITTLAPLANLRFSMDDQNRWSEFNSFLVDNFPNVLDIASCFLSESNRVIYECYQLKPKYVSGCNQAHLLWNYIGRQRVVKHLKNSLLNDPYGDSDF
ncbi:Maternal effect protein oskar [Pseudolycoriella hygida]|uniref:Maternal effect protein oskar n=1 Tax=Pseudolycoriella hygida TaxID=35572 RepID=A0A9Q0NHG0_9DIPT|nr:Maternal effect protein oskar [Pseudolycoriella hygida]